MTRDPLEEFFARERGDVHELAPAPHHWDSLVERSSRPARRGWVPYVAVAAAAAVVGGVLVTDALRDDRPDSITAATSSASTTPTDPPSSSAPTSAATSSAPVASSTPVTTVPSGPLPVPASFDLVSMTNAGDGHLFAIGAATCPQGPCTSVVASEDDGRTWAARSTFEDLVPAGPRATPDGPGEVVGVRFATPEVGYVYGSTVRRTTDGGRSWHDVDVDRRVVLSLETDGSRVWMATALRCSHAEPDLGCRDLQPRTGSVGDDTTTAVALDGVPSHGDGAWVTLDGEDAYYNVTQPDGSPVPAVRLSGTPGVLPVPEGCAEGMWVSGTASTRGTLLAVCRSVDRSEEEYSLAVSTDAGTTWSTRAAPDLGAPERGGVWLTASDATRLVAVRGGQASSTPGVPATTRLLVSSDGGTHWRSPRAAPSAPSDWAGAAGGRLVYAVGGGRAYWASRDGGESFTAVPLRR